MADDNNQVQIEKLSLLEDSLDGPLLEAFSTYEAINPQFGENWLSNLASHALNEHDKAVVFVARLTPDNFVAFPITLNSRNGQAQALGNFYTSAYSPVARSDTPQILFSALFQHLARVEKITALTLSPMDRNSTYFGQIHHALQQTGWHGIHSYFCFGNWIHNVAGDSYLNYLESRPSRLRSTVARKTRKFLEAGRGHLRIVQGGALLETAIEQFIAVYNCSWKRQEPYPRFIPELLRLSARRGWLRLGIASYDDKPVASQVWLVWEGTAYIFKLAYHDNYKQLSAGTVLTAFMMEYVIDKDGVLTIDYLSGDDDYKKDWMSARRERHGLAAYNPWTLRGKAMSLRHTMKGLVGQLYKKSSTSINPRENRPQ